MALLPVKAFLGCPSPQGKRAMTALRGCQAHLRWRGMAEPTYGRVQTAQYLSLHDLSMLPRSREHAGYSSFTAPIRMLHLPDNLYRPVIWL
eukprot:4711298-Pleurochrysis_carterae.AAC.1